MTNTDMSLRDAAQAVIDRWETPLWRDAPATAVFIADLRKALARDAGRASLSANAGEPVAHLWQHCATGRTRIVMPDMIVDADASWQVVGPLYLGAAPPTAQAEGWISVAERLPAAYATVLLTIDGKHITTGEYIRSLSCFSWNTHDDETDDSRVTHWMPLPPPPTPAEGVGHG